MGNPSAPGSRFSILAETEMKLFFIIKIEYMDSCTPVAPSEWPVKDLVELIVGI